MRRATVIVLVVAALSVAGCSDDSTSSDPSGHAGGTLRLQVSGEPEETQVFASIARAYERANAGVEVEVVEIASKGDHLARLSTSFAAGNPPDVFLLNYREYSQFVARGAVEAVQPYLDEEGVDMDAYYERPVEAFTYDGRLQCTPQNVSSLVVYYNRAVFEAAGVEEPADDWTWDDFVRTAEALTDGGVRGAGFDASLIRRAIRVVERR